MVIPGSTYWNMAYGLGPGEVENDAEGLRNMQHIGRGIAWLGEAMSQCKTPYPVLQSAEA